MDFVRALFVRSVVARDGGPLFWLISVHDSAIGGGIIKYPLFYAHETVLARPGVPSYAGAVYPGRLEGRETEIAYCSRNRFIYYAIGPFRKLLWPDVSSDVGYY